MAKWDFYLHFKTRHECFPSFDSSALTHRNGKWIWDGNKEAVLICLSTLFTFMRKRLCWACRSSLENRIGTKAVKEGKDVLHFLFFCYQLLSVEVQFPWFRGFRRMKEFERRSRIAGEVVPPVCNLKRFVGGFYSQ
jgi:hypothetical protein